MVKVYEVTVSLSFPTIEEMELGRKPKYNKIKEFQYDEDDIDNKDSDIEQFVDESINDLLEEFPEDYEDGVGVYYISKKAYDGLSEDNQKKYEIVSNDTSEVLYIIPKPIISVNEESDMVANTMEEKMSEVGMTRGDFLW